MIKLKNNGDSIGIYCHAEVKDDFLSLKQGDWYEEKKEFII